MEAIDEIKKLEESINSNIIGQHKVVRRMLMALLADGNILLEGLPGLAKTRAIKTLADYLAVSLSRIQFTPDLLPSDVTGTEVLKGESGEFEFQQGPVFANLVLADEINRAPAKVQSALLEAMQEKQVTVNGKRHKLPAPFMVMATQNPVEQEGTYPLPEAQMDRFIMHVMVEYPSADSEVEIIRLVRSEEKPQKGETIEKISTDVVFAARDQIFNIKVGEQVEQYMVKLIDATRFPEKYDDSLAKWIDFGASPRGTISLDKLSRVAAWYEGRDHVTPDDVREIVYSVLRHRLILSYEANADGITPDKVIDKLLEVVAVI